MRLLVTGCAGFIGSHLVDRLLAGGHSVVGIDDLSLGRLENLLHLGTPNFRFHRADLLDGRTLPEIFRSEPIDAVFHLAANSDIENGAANPAIDFERTLLTTVRVLEAMRQSTTKQILFASSSAVYGELPGKLREDSGPLLPVSHYGAAKLAAEAFLSSFCESFGYRCWIFRFPNVVGARATHGVIFDFIRRLRENPRRLLVKGDGKQSKPYLLVDELLDAIFFTWKHASDRRNLFNLGTDSEIVVNELARIVAEEMELPRVAIAHTGGRGGWVGDVPRFQYDLSRIHALGWRARYSASEAVRQAVRAQLAWDVPARRVAK